MLFQPTNIIPDLRTGIGFGTADADSGIQFSWQVNGDHPVMTAFRIIIYENDPESTELYDTGRLTTGCPFSGRDAKGEIQFFAYTVAAPTLAGAGIENGSEYKYTIRQYYDEGGAETSILQSSASVFLTRQTPVFAFSGLQDGAFSTDSADRSFSVTYSQADGDTLEWIRYRIAYGSTENAPVYDSGNLFGVTEYVCYYDGFLSREDETMEIQPYYIRATGQTSSGVAMDTGWTLIDVRYETEGEETGALRVTPAAGLNAVLVDWNGVEWTEDDGETPLDYDAVVLFRQRDAEAAAPFEKLAELQKNGSRKYCDFGFGSGQGPYTYYLFPQATEIGTGKKLYTAPPASGRIAPVSAAWSLLLCREDGEGGFLVEREFDFRFNMDSGAVGNNNEPGVMKNFTEKPTVQPSPQNYRSGTLRALVGRVSFPGEYSDTLEERNALMALSTTENALFLKSSKGDVLEVRISGPVTVETTEGTKELAQTVSVPWVEIDDAPARLYRLDGESRNAG